MTQDKERRPGKPTNRSTFFPYLVDDPAQLRREAPRVYLQLKNVDLPEATRHYCVDVFQSWLMARFKGLEEILTMLGELTPLEETRAHKELVAKGQRIGRQTEAQALIQRLLQRRIGLVTPDQQARILALSVDELESLGEALLDFRTPADLTAWLERR